MATHVDNYLEALMELSGMDESIWTMFQHFDNEDDPELKSIFADICRQNWSVNLTEMRRLYCLAEQWWQILIVFLIFFIFLRCTDIMSRLRAVYDTIDIIV